MGKPEKREVKRRRTRRRDKRSVMHPNSEDLDNFHKGQSFEMMTSKIIKRRNVIYDAWKQDSMSCTKPKIVESEEMSGFKEISKPKEPNSQQFIRDEYGKTTVSHLITYDDYNSKDDFEGVEEYYCRKHRTCGHYYKCTFGECSEADFHLHIECELPDQSVLAILSKEDFLEYYDMSYADDYYRDQRRMFICGEYDFYGFYR